MFRITRNGEIEVSVEVIETEIVRLSKNDPATLRVAGLGEFEGKVRQISPRVNARTRLGEVRISLPANPALRLGLFASGWIETDRFKALSVPLSAILADQDGDFVLVVDDGGIVHKRPVKPGLVWQGRREIRAGLKEGETVMLRAGAFFRDGDHVTSVFRKPEHS